MKKLTKEVAGKAPAELQKELISLRNEVAKLQVDAKAKPQKDSNLKKKKEKRIAVILTVMKEKELGIIK